MVVELKRQMEDCASSSGSAAAAAAHSTASGVSAGTAWRPGAGTAFGAYGGASLRSTGLGIVKRKSVVLSLTRDIVETYTRCNPDFRYSEALNPKRYLTNPSAAVLNSGHDNANSDLVLYVNLELVNLKQNRRYIVKEMLGQGTFGQVAKCWDAEINNYVAVKVIKNQPAYTQQAVVEVSILDTLNRKYDPEDQNHIVRILDYFMHHQHLCIAFEMLGSNLYEVIKGNKYKGLPLSFVQRFSKQILHALIVMKDAGIIHCDLKPENILLCPRAKPAEIKVIDFGSACEEGRTIYSYIQSRYYRSPEVLLGYPYTTAIDMWSFGCIVAELFLGLPLFPGASEYDLLKRMMEILSGQPPDNLLRDAKNTTKFFKQVGRSAYQVLTEEEYEARESKRPQIGKRYFKYTTLEDIISLYPYRNNMGEDEILKESLVRKALIDFLRGLVEFDPVKRWSPLQAFYHPFVTGDEFTEPYRPPPETPRIPVFQAVMVDHNPGIGHWVAAGLSPQVGSRNRHTPYTNSPHFPRLPLSYGSSYGSVGSHGSYNDNNGVGTSYGSSYGDHNTTNNNPSYFSHLGPPGGYNLHGQVGGIFLGSSPDVRRRPQQYNNNNPNTGLGLSPSNLGPMSLGVSPSQYTPPNSHSHMQVIPGASSGRYGPTSPVRGGAHNPSSLGKQAAVGQYNRRRWTHLPASMPHYDHAHGHYNDGPSTSHHHHHHHHHHDGSNRGVGYSHSMLSHSSPSNWRQRQQQISGGGIGGSSARTTREVSVSNSSAQEFVSGRSEVANDAFVEATSIPDPADWDPNYSEESLLQDDNSDVNDLSFSFNNGLHLGNNTMGATGALSGHTVFAHAQGQPPPSSNYISLNQRYGIHRPPDASSSSVGDGFSGTNSSNAGGYFNQIYNNNNNRQHRQSGQQPSQRGLINYQFNATASASSGSNYTRVNDRIHQNGHAQMPYRPGYGIDQSHPSNSLLGNGIWGPRGGHSLGTALPPRNEFGQQIL